MSERKQCSESVFAGTTMVRGWHDNKKCSKPAKVERDGKWWCAIHDPVAAEERRKKRNAEWDAKWAAERKRQRLERAAPLLGEALKVAIERGSLDSADLDVCLAALRAAGLLPDRPPDSSAAPSPPPPAPQEGK